MGTEPTDDAPNRRRPVLLNFIVASIIALLLLSLLWLVGWPLALAAGALLFVVISILELPNYLMSRDLKGRPEPEDVVALLKAKNDVRTTLIQAFGGALLLVGAFLTWRQVQATGHQVQLTQDQLKVSEQGQITERLTRAADQLGSETLDVRLAAAYALQRIAEDSPRDRAAIADILASYVRVHAPWPPSASSSYSATYPPQKMPLMLNRSPDVQAIITILGQSDYLQEGHNRLPLRNADLRRVDMTDGNLENEDFFGAHLEWSYLTRSILREAELRDAHLQHSSLRDADLQGAALTGANLEGAYLGGAILARADLSRARLRGSIANRATTWPAGFNPRAAGVKFEDNCPVLDPNCIQISSP